jgi:hypothetical protein
MLQTRKRQHALALTMSDPKIDKVVYLPWIKVPTVRSCIPSRVINVHASGVLKLLHHMLSGFNSVRA